MFASRAMHVEVSGIRKMFDLASANAINLGLGEPDFQPPRNVINAFKSAVEKGLNKYGPTGGIGELREAVAQRLARYTDVKKEDILITSGATEALCVTMQTLIDRGDEVLTPDPGFVLFAPHVTLAGGTPVFYSLRQEKRFMPDVGELERLVTPHTKAIIVNTPSNPTGTVMDRRTIQDLVAFAEEHRLIVIADEVYDAIVYDGKHETFLGEHDKVVYVNSFSKSFAMTGWRLGYLSAPPEMIKQMAKIHYYMVACPSTPAQYAVLEGLRGPKTYLEEMVAEFKTRRDLIVRLLSKIPGFRCLKPKGAFYAFPSVDFGMKSEELALEILKAGVICTPGSAFGEAGEGHLRFSYANSQENIKRAMEIVSDVASHLA